MKRYTIEELETKLEEIVYDYLATEENLYFQDRVISSGKSVPVLIHERREQLVKDIKYRIKYYRDKLAGTTDKTEIGAYEQAIEVLESELERNVNTSIEDQKARYAETKEVYSSTTYAIVPLNKKLNAFYDDFNVVVCFYDDLTNKKGVKGFTKLTTKEEKLEWVKSHIEITHILMTLSRSVRTGFAIKGKVQKQFSDPKSTNCDILPKQFADFNTITLADCENIANNDLKQIIQERIDMDKENLELLANKDVKGDNYRIYKSDSDMYIRYVCPSTGRVYYNAIDTNYLSESKYFIEDNFESYILAWYSINNLFMELDEDELSVEAIRC